MSYLTQANHQHPLTNGTYSALNFTVSQYGAYSIVSDVLQQQGFDSLDDIQKAVEDPEMLKEENKWREHFGMEKKLDWAKEAWKYQRGTHQTGGVISGSGGGLASGIRLTKQQLSKAVQNIRNGQMTP